MSISELQEGPQDPTSCLVNFAFQLVLDGQKTHISNLRREQCLEAGIDPAICGSISLSALQIANDPRNAHVKGGFVFASSIARMLVGAAKLNS